MARWEAAVRRDRPRRFALAASALLGASVLALPPTTAHAATQQGIDVSPYQGSINWGAVAASGVSFAYIKAWEGTCCYRDGGWFQANWNAAVSVGITPGAYLYFHPADDPNVQASELIQQLASVGFHQGDLPPVFDVEVTDGLGPASVAASLRTAVNDVQAAIGALPAIYTAPSWWDGNVQSSSFTADPLWVANWCGCPQPALPASGWGGHGYQAWQYTDAASVPGISGNVDGDVGNPGPPIYYGGFTADRPQQLVAAGVTGDPQAVWTGAGRSQVFWRGADGRLAALFDTDESVSLLWNAAMPANMASDPAAVALPGGTVEVFWQSTAGELWMATNTTGSWQAQDLGISGLASAPRATVGPGDAVALAWQSSDGTVWTVQIAAAARTVPRSVGASNAGGDAYPVYVSDTTLAVFWRGSDQNLWWDVETGSTWQGAENLGAGPLASDPRPVSPEPGVIEVAWLGSDGIVWQAMYAGGWGPPGALSGTGINSMPDTISPAPGTLADFVRDSVGGLWMTTYGSAGWTVPSIMGSVLAGSDLTAAPAQVWGHFDIFWADGGGLDHIAT